MISKYFFFLDNWQKKKLNIYKITVSKSWLKVGSIRRRSQSNNWLEIKFCIQQIGKVTFETWLILVPSLLKFWMSYPRIAQQCSLVELKTQDRKKAWSSGSGCSSLPVYHIIATNANSIKISSLSYPTYHES
jgi:hypothetical protein